jgi:21S rRNA (GM2251-2'-O)-methyltransferase
MNLTRIRLFSSTCCAGVKSPLGSRALKGRELPGNRSTGGHNFDKNFPEARKNKAWDGKDREQFFKQKYAHVHAKQKRFLDREKGKIGGRHQHSTIEEKLEENRKRSRDVVKKLKPISHTEYVYGTSAVKAALRNPARADGHSELFILKGIQHTDDAIVRLAKELKVPVDRDAQRHELNAWTENGVHNGYALKTRPLKPQSIDSLGPVQEIEESVESETVDEETQKTEEVTTATSEKLSTVANEASAETKIDLSQKTESDTAAAPPAVEEEEPVDEIEFLDEEDLGSHTPLSFIVNEVNAYSGRIEPVAHDVVSPTTKTNVLGIYIDQVTDPHNLGAILRSAHFLGADFAVMSELNCAKLTPVAAKSAAGAIDSFKIFTCDAPLKLFEKSAAAGWNIVATVPPSVKLPHAKRVAPRELALLGLGFQDGFRRGPCLLAIGSESEGLRKSLLNRCTHVVSIPKAGGTVDDVVDSLNVSVATALLISNFMLE